MMARTLTTELQDGKEIRAVLLEKGAEHFGTFPWHTSTDPYVVLICELLLKRTKRVVVARVLPSFLEAYPTPSALAHADPDELYERIRPVGLARRTKRLPLVGRALVERGEVPTQREQLMELPEVGDYVADAMGLYMFGAKCFPRDRNVQRVLVRALHGLQPDRGIDPYTDGLLGEDIALFLATLNVVELRHVHQGVLAIAWSHCGPHPKCSSCPLSELCLWARVTQGAVLVD